MIKMFMRILHYCNMEMLCNVSRICANIFEKNFLESFYKVICRMLTKNRHNLVNF